MLSPSDCAQNLQIRSDHNHWFQFQLSLLQANYKLSRFMSFVKMLTFSSCHDPLVRLPLAPLGFCHLYLKCKWNRQVFFCRKGNTAVDFALPHHSIHHLPPYPCPPFLIICPVPTPLCLSCSVSYTYFKLCLHCLSYYGPPNVSVISGMSRTLVVAQVWVYMPHYANQNSLK
ncbi:hypothetical protein XENORESO_016455 [Xenotaenia resolanae]|uniref:Uncharacterized protein n=1 Tax=Xenotaenia resolanae TaxID=208358 RepID=A0ABV0W5Q1_9TELE